MPYKIYISAGETSGDIHGAGLAEELFKIQPDIRISGMGGEQMKNAGVNIFRDCHEYTVMGFAGVISSLFKFKKLLSDVAEFIKNDKVDLIVLIDYSGFNLRLARAVKPLGVKIVYFISPQVWAWRTGRIRAIRDYVDRMITIFPFEKEFYKKFGIVADYVGHPMLESIPEIAADERRKISAQFRKSLGLHPDTPLLGLLPGSRRQELDRMLVTMLRTAELLRKGIPNLNVLIALAPDLDTGRYINKPEFSSVEPIVLKDKVHDILFASDAVLVSSGTTTVEAALCGAPQVVMYKTSYLTYLIAHSMVHVDHIAMANLIAGRRVVPEFVQNNANPDKLKNELYPLLTNPEYRDKARKAASDIRNRLGKSGAYKRAAEIVSNTVKKMVDGGCK